MSNKHLHARSWKLASTLILSLLGSGAAVSAAPRTGDFIERPDRVAVSDFRQGLQVRLDNGGTLRFIEVTDPRGMTLGFLINESSPPRAPRISQDAGLRKIKPVDLIWAVTEPGKRMPELLTSHFGDPDVSLPQGWARPRLGLTGEMKGGADGHCNEQEDFSSFAGDIHDFGYGLVFLSEDDGPQSKPQHWFDEPNEDDPHYSRLTGAAYDVRAFYAQVKFCSVDDYSVADPQNPWWGYDYRVSGGQWENIDGGYFDDVGNEDSFWWHPVEHNWGLPETPEIDFRIRIGRTLPGSLFWIGATWSKPFDTLSGN
jgi:hypothetical protein